MQTFLPYANFAHSASVLDRQRLGKQRVENLQIMKALVDPSYGWQKHPVVRMWRGYEGVFIDYQFAICSEWSTVRGYNDTCWVKTVDIWISAKCVNPPYTIGYPQWLGDENLHASHRSNLLRKDADWYGQYGWTEPDDLDYFWPVQ